MGFRTTSIWNSHHQVVEFWEFWGQHSGSLLELQYPVRREFRSEILVTKRARYLNY